MSKLFSEKDSEHYNIYKFISKLKLDGHYGDALISVSEIEAWEKRLADNKDSISNLILQRNKVYAHTDRNSKEVPNTVTITKTRELIEIIQKIIREVYFTVFESSFIVDSPVNAPVDNLKWVIGALAKEKKRKRIAMKKSC